VAHGQQLVVLADLDGDDAVGLELGVVGSEQRLLDDAFARAEDEELALADVEVARVDDGADLP
jgi:hypothetical protein